MSLLSIKNLNVYAGDTHIVKGLSLSLKAGETLCVVGESGSGKTLSSLAVMHLLADGLTSKSDELMFDGKDMRVMSAKQLRLLRGRVMSMIFQEPMTALNPVMTVGAQVAEVYEIHTKKSKKEQKKSVLKLFRKVKLPNIERMFSSYPHQLSGGQRQRVMIAMALAMKPKLLIADEPTTALDVTVQGDILKLIKDLQKEMNTAVLFVTHDFGVVKQIADSIVVMENGKLVESGVAKTILKNPKKPYTKRLLAAMPLLDKKPKVALPKTAKNILEVKNLSKIYEIKKKTWFTKGETLQALKKVSFSLKEGQTLGVVGESGCGKSTLAKCLTRLISSNAGQVVFLGNDILTLAPKKLKQARRHMQMVFQDPFSSLNPRMKIGETVGEGLKAHNIMTSPARQKFVKKLLKDCGLPKGSYNRYPHQFSGGQRQRIGIARALALKPKVIIADEAVSSLDVSVQKQILELMDGLKNKYKLSYIFISHDLRVVSQVSDEVIVMHNGRIVEAGKTHKVFSKPQHAYTQKLLAAIPGQ